MYSTSQQPRLPSRDVKKRLGKLLGIKKSKLQQVVAIVICILSFSVICNIMIVHSRGNIDEAEIKRRLCARKLKEKDGNETDPGGGSFFTDLVDRTLVSQVEVTDEDCDTVYPAEVANVTGVDYYADPAVDSGVYYREEIPAPVVDAELQGTTEEISPLILNPDANGRSAITSVDTNLLDMYQPKSYEPVSNTTRPEGTTAYTVVITSCPDTYSPPGSEVTDPGSDIFEASAMLKQFVCQLTESTVTERRRERKLRGLQDSTTEDTAIANYTMYALVHPTAVNCPNPDGTTYNRVELLQQQGYHVEIVGQPITDVDLSDKQPYIEEHIEDDVGVRDSMALHAFNLEEHNAVVLVDYNTQLQHSIQDEIDELVHDPDMQVKYVKDKDGGVSKGFMIVKPSKQVFETYKNDYLSTPYDPVGGWNNYGICTCHGYIGLKGYFAYRAQVDPAWSELDRCTYNNQLDDYCISTFDASQSKVVRHSNRVCGQPRDCPYSLSTWSTAKKTACNTIHKNYMLARIELEEKHLVKQILQERIGRFKHDTFMGYCDGPGTTNYLGITRKIRLKPSWQTVCPPTICGPGSYMTPDCSCTFPYEDPCNACPSGTRCQRYPVLMCIDCECGFCDSGGNSCCSGEINQCGDGPGDNNECNTSYDNFPAFGGYGDICNAIGLTDTMIPNGCGCKPSATLPCVYNKDLQNVYEDKCYMCNTNDIAEGKCPSCVECLRHCDSCIYDYYHFYFIEGYARYSSVSDIDAYKWCLGKMSNSCRESCSDSCKKI